MKKAKITERDQQVAADILTQFMFTRDMKDVTKVWDDVYKQYGLCDDPFTYTPVSPKEYYKNRLEYDKNRLEYDKQVMIDKYGHCDGLE